MDNTVKAVLLTAFVVWAVALFGFGLIFFGPKSEVLAPENFSSPQPPQERKLWGAYTGDTADSFLDFEKLIDAKPDMYAVFVGWYDPFPAGLALPLKTNNQTLIVFWEQYDVRLDQILDGSQDAYIKQFAQDAKAYGVPVILSPLHEMNGDWSPWCGVAQGNSPEKVILAFRHMHNIFDSIDVQNIKWAWIVNNESVPDIPQNQIINYYPGDKYIDYVGVDGFNFGDPWESYDEIFSSSLEELKTYNKPIYIFSMASAQGPQKADWIKDALSKIKSDSRIKGFIWFNENKEENWLINSDSASLQAFKEGIK